MPEGTIVWLACVGLVIAFEVGAEGEVLSSVLPDETPATANPDATAGCEGCVSETFDSVVSGWPGAGVLPDCLGLEDGVKESVG